MNHSRRDPVTGRPIIDFYSDDLGLQGKKDTITGKITMKEKDFFNNWIEYSQRESNIINQKENVREVKKQVHLFKKTFGGQIVS